MWKFGRNLPLAKFGSERVKKTDSDKSALLPDSTSSYYQVGN